MSNKRQDLIGKRYGRGTVTRLLGSNQYHCFEWELVCDCGNIYKATTGNLNSGHILSCKCYNKEVVTRNTTKATEKITLPNGHAARNELYRSYVKRAGEKGLSFDLSKEQFLSLAKENCKYCGVEPKAVFHAKTGDYVYNGIDRVDPDKGYTIKNSVPCCKRCNQGKNNMTFAEFMEWINRVINWQGVRYEP